jgi:L-seryl-tRNA(Ser) seleniumtransferase
MSDSSSILRALPSVDELLRQPELAPLFQRALQCGGVRARKELAARHLDGLRRAVREKQLDRAALERGLEPQAQYRALEALLLREEGAGLRRCINATGVVLNTGLGRAPVHPEVAERMAEVARSYCVLEVDRWTNERNQRDDRLGVLLTRLTGAEAAIAVNNCAAAVMLIFQTFAGGREAVVSRGELVEIGGSFRVPDVMARAGARLVEVGTTNRTRIADYERAISERTGLLMKVHTSNYRVIGFTEEATPQELAVLARSKGVVSAFDLGSGLLEDDSMRPIAPVLGDEPLLGAALESGVDVVSFSGDKLLGAPQAGILIGRRAAISALRKNPLYRALRLDKVTLAGLEAMLELILAGRGDELPVRRMLLEPAQAILPRAKALAQRISRLPGCSACVLDDHSQPGSGSAPGTWIPTFVAEVGHELLSAQALSLALRSARVPVFSRVQENRVRLDPRTLLPGDEEDLLAAFVELTR